MTTKRPFLVWQTREKVITGVCALIITLGGAWVVMTKAINACDAAIDMRICKTEMKFYDTLHAPLIARVNVAVETADKTYCLVKYKMSRGAIDSALHERDVDRGVRGRTERRW